MSRKRKTADEFITTNKEYDKLKKDRPEGESPRELPGQQSPGKEGHEKPDYSAWTTEELRAFATHLGIANIDQRSRPELERALKDHDAEEGRRGTSGNPAARGD